MKRRDHVCGVMESCFAPSHSLRRLDDDGASCLFAELDARNYQTLITVAIQVELDSTSHECGSLAESSQPKSRNTPQAALP